MQKFIKIRNANCLKLGLLLLLHSGLSAAHPADTGTDDDGTISLEPVEVQGRATDLIGIASSASEGIVGQPEFNYRPLSRVGELVEVVPGAVATQHSGSGKANQYFLRGFNLDHGTDFSISVDGIPMNMPSHAHGQGYLDLNSVIPELVDKVEYGKGPYYAEVGDFSAAGYARMHTMHKVPEGFVKFTGGEFDYYRTVLANSNRLGSGDLLYAAEMNFYDGVWQQPEDLDKYNGIIRYTVDHENQGWSVNGKAYHSGWTATNQIPERAIAAGTLDRYGTLDPSDGGKSNRYSLSGNIWKRGDAYKSDVNVYALYSDLDLYSNFTGAIDTVNGDQIQQKERRIQTGGNAEHTVYGQWLGFETDNTIGLQLRHDEITGLALNHTKSRQWLAAVRADAVSETSVGLYVKNETHWLEKFRSIAGLRSDFFDFDVNSQSLAANFGNKGAALLSPKLSLIAGPWNETDFFVNLGYSYHSNDARGTTIHVDPSNGGNVDSVTPLVWSRGGEIGLRSQAISGLNTTLAFWYLENNSELVFVGDGGTTEPSGKSERYGVEWTNYYQPTDWLTLDADFAFTTAHFVGVPETANRIPNSVGRVISIGATAALPSGLFGSLRLRHFGDVPLNETATAFAGTTNILNMGLGYQQSAYKLELDIFNLLDSIDNDIAYFYGSRLKNEAAGDNADGSIDGILKHPIEPRMVRLTATLKF